MKRSVSLFVLLLLLLGLCTGCGAQKKTAEEVVILYTNDVHCAVDTGLGYESLAAVKQALLAGGSPATPEDLRRRFESFMTERCKGKDASKLRFVVE